MCLDQDWVQTLKLRTLDTSAVMCLETITYSIIYRNKL